ncbi:MAG: hypothetical protein ACE5R6_05295 [Candidatus Heimdallarchaeota archaeon]
MPQLRQATWGILKDLDLNQSGPPGQLKLNNEMNGQIRMSKLCYNG